MLGALMLQATAWQLLTRPRRETSSRIEGGHSFTVDMDFITSTTSLKQDSTPDARLIVEKAAKSGRKTEREEKTGIGGLKDDCLSLIFEFNAKMDWKTPYKLQLVCRRWHAVLCHTPLAWSAAYFSKNIKPDDIMGRTFAKSGNVPLHVAGSLEFDSRHLSAIQSRVCCLSLDSQLPDLWPDAQFPLLCHLRTRQTEGWVRHYPLTEEVFPSIRHLDLEIIKQHDGFRFEPSFRHLESCRLVMYIDYRWETLIRSCQSTLTYLDIVYPHILTLTETIELSLPRLLHLSLMDLRTRDRQSQRSYARFQTSSLTSYEQYVRNTGERVRVLLHEDVRRVTRAKTNMPLGLQGFDSLEEITVIDARDASVMLESMRSDASLAPQLRKIIAITRRSESFGRRGQETHLWLQKAADHALAQKISFEQFDERDDPFLVINKFGKCDYSIHP